MNEQQSLHHSQSMAISRKFLGLWLLKNPKKSVSLTDSDVHTLWKEKKTKIRPEKPQVMYSVAVKMVFLAAENENRQLKDFF